VALDVTVTDALDVDDDAGSDELDTFDRNHADGPLERDDSDDEPHIVTRMMITSRPSSMSATTPT
jgi:hypothetical protein